MARSEDVPSVRGGTVIGVDIERVAYMQSRDAALRVDDHSEVASASYGGRHYSLFVEACKPGDGADA